MVAFLSVVCTECGMRHELKITEATARKIVADMDAAPRKDELGRTFDKMMGSPMASLDGLIESLGMK